MRPGGRRGRQELGILTVAVVTKPFSFEGAKRLRIAEDRIAKLSQHVDSVITIPNEKLLSVLGKTTSLLDAFKAANDVLLNAVQGIAELITGRSDQRGLRRRAHRDVGDGRGDDGHRSCKRRAPRARGARTGDPQPVAGGHPSCRARADLVNITAGLDLAIGGSSTRSAIP